MIASLLQQKYPDVELYIKERKTGGNIVLDTIRVPAELRGQGIGTKVMQDLCDYADQKGVKVFCTPSTELGGSSKSRLMDFYKRFGFTLNKGRNKDFSEQQSMVRFPNGGINESLDRIKALMNLNEQDAGFNPQALTGMTSFRARVQYCTQHLGKPLGSGSSRIVFDMGDKVLKLAKNKKGLDQNDAESDYSIQNGYSIVTHIFGSDEQNNTWIVAEKALKARPSDFPECVGYSFEVVQGFLDSVAAARSNKHQVNPETALSREQIDELWEIEFFQELAGLVSSYDMPVGDFQRISSWGITDRKGHKTVVLTDYGLTQNVWDTHYLREFDN